MLIFSLHLSDILIFDLENISFAPRILLTFSRLLFLSEYFLFHFFSKFFENFIDCLSAIRQSPGTVFTTLYFLRNFQMGTISWSVCSWQASSLVYCLRVRPQPTRMKHLSVAPFSGRLLALPQKHSIRLEKPVGTNTLAYWAHLWVTKKYLLSALSSIAGVNVIKHFPFVTNPLDE